MMDSIKPQRGQRLTGIKHLIAPLLGLSLGLHGLLLLTPLPTSDPEPEAQEPEPSEAESTVDLLSISRLATASPIPASPPPTAAPPAAPPPVAALPQAPTPYPTDIPPTPLAPEAEAVAIEETTGDSVPPPATDIPSTEPVTDPPTPGFDPNRQAQMLGAASGGLGRAPGSSNFDLTDQFPGDIWDLYISRWAAAKKQCFFNTIDRDGYALRAPAADLRYLSRNIQLVEQQDIPRTFAEQTVQPLGSAYCEANLFEVQDNGVPILWVSLVPVSPGGSTTLVVFWQADPRL